MIYEAHNRGGFVKIYPIEETGKPDIERSARYKSYCSTASLFLADLPIGKTAAGFSKGRYQEKEETCKIEKVPVLKVQGKSPAPKTTLYGSPSWGIA